MAEITATLPATRNPIAEVLALPGFRSFWIAQLMVSTVSGTIRFAFVWLVLDLTSWSPAVGIIGFTVGLPLTLLSLPAGVLSDRHDRRKLVATFAAVGSCVLVATGLLAGAEVTNVAAIAGLALLTGSCLALVLPALQAMVPALVPPERLVTGIALQGIGQNVAQMSGVLIGGAAIQLLGTPRSFLVLAVLLATAAVMMLRVPIVAAGAAGRSSADDPYPAADSDPAEAPHPPMLAAILAGLRHVLSADPMKTVMAIAFVGGTCGGMVQLILPAIARDHMHVGAFAASLLFGALGFSMLLSTLYVASHRRLRRPGVVLGVGFAATCGPGMIVMGATGQYGAALLGMVIWGAGGGFVLTTQRTLLQTHTPDEMMGRALGAHTLALNGTFPIAALSSAVLVAHIGTQAALVVWGIGALVAGVLLGVRRGLRDA